MLIIATLPEKFLMNAPFHNGSLVNDQDQIG
jgi:hypothetical protein